MPWSSDLLGPMINLILVIHWLTMKRGNRFVVADGEHIFFGASRMYVKNEPCALKEFDLSCYRNRRVIGSPKHARLKRQAHALPDISTVIFEAGSWHRDSTRGPKCSDVRTIELGGSGLDSVCSARRRSKEAGLRDNGSSTTHVPF